MSITRNTLSKHGQELGRVASHRATFSGVTVRMISQSASRPESQKSRASNTNKDQIKNEPQEEGAMSRRLAQMAEDSLETSSRSSQQAVTDSVFDEDLKKRLEERIASASISSTHPQASALANLPSSAGRGTQDIAGAKPWTGNEAMEDTALRMLTDAHKPLSRGVRGAPPIPMPKMTKGKQSSGVRLANARDRSSVYSNMKGSMTPEEQEQYRKELKGRFQPGARDIPATLTGLASLANERIEEAIARGQFKNIPRGKKIERDHNADSPFIDTTEYLMNKMLKKQEIVPPWIEKQQEIATAARTFRQRLRNDWRRHAARTISSAGGSLEKQISRAEEYAAAEIVDTAAVSVEAKTPEDHASQISLSGQLAAPSPPNESNAEGIPGSPEVIDSKPLPWKRYPLRDPIWEQTERKYHELSITSLNSLTRTYNLMAPTLAQKPYFNLRRELKACYTEVAPQIAAEIRQRAMAPKTSRYSAMSTSTTPISLLPNTAKEKPGDDAAKKGLLRQLWKELWSSPTS